MMRNESTTAAPTLEALMHTAALRIGPLSDAPRLESELLGAHAAGLDRRQLRTYGARRVTPSTRTRFDALLARRLAGEPIAYILGEWEFWSLALEVTADVLVPRPETERLVERALECIALREAPRVLDLGTGSGAVAIAIAHERSDAAVTAVEKSRAALAIATRNCARHGLERVELIEGSWFAPVAGRRFDLILSNPPYVAVADPDLSPVVARWEPAAALFAGVSGLEAIEHIVASARAHLAPGGRLLFEHGATQGRAARALLAHSGYSDIETARDFAGHERVSGGCG